MTPLEAKRIFDRLITNQVTLDKIHFVSAPSVPAAEMETRSTIDELAENLLADETDKVYALSGQLGCGKSIALYQLRQRDGVRGAYQVVEVRGINQLPPLDVDIRLVLLCLAENLSSVIAGPLRVKAEAIEDEFATGTLWQWIQLLSSTKKDDLPPQPKNFADYAAKINLGIGELNFSLRNDTARRVQLRADKTYDVDALLRLTSVLAVVAQRAAKAMGFKGVLLVMDDLDKFRDRKLFKLFEQDISRLASIPCKIIVTLPYYLNFEPTFASAVSTFRTYTIQNTKIVRLDAPTSVLASGREFFIELYKQHATEELFSDGPDLTKSAVFDAVVLLSAGIPREFFRILRAAFDICDVNNKPALTPAVVKAAAVKVAQEMIRASQLASTRGSLKIVQLTQQLQSAKEWTLLDSLQVVEYVNDRPWYSSHPLLADWVSGQIVDDGAALGLWSRLNLPTSNSDSERPKQLLLEINAEQTDQLLARARSEAQRDDRHS